MKRDELEARRMMKMKQEKHAQKEIDSEVQRLFELAAE